MPEAHVMAGLFAVDDGLLDAAPGEEAMKWVLQEEPTEGVIIVALHLPS